MTISACETHRIIHPGLLDAFSHLYKGVSIRRNVNQSNLVEFLRNQELFFRFAYRAIHGIPAHIQNFTHFGDLFAFWAASPEEAGWYTTGSVCHLYVHLSIHFPQHGLIPGLTFQARPLTTKSRP